MGLQDALGHISGVCYGLHPAKDLRTRLLQLLGKTAHIPELKILLIRNGPRFESGSIAAHRCQHLAVNGVRLGSLPVEPCEVLCLIGMYDDDRHALSGQEKSKGLMITSCRLHEERIRNGTVDLIPAPCQ